MTRLSLNIEKVADLSELDKSFKFSITFVREETTVAGGFIGIKRPSLCLTFTEYNISLELKENSALYIKKKFLT